MRAFLEIIEPSYGFLVPYKGIGTVVSCLTMLQQNPSLCLKMSEAARFAVSQRIAPERIGGELLNYFQHIIAHHAAQNL